MVLFACHKTSLLQTNDVQQYEPIQAQSFFQKNLIRKVDDVLSR